MNNKKTRLQAHQFDSFEKLIKGIVLSLFAWFASTIMVLLAREAQKDVPISVVLFFQNILGVLFTCPFVIQHHRRSPSKTPWGLIAIRCVSGQLAVFFQFLTVTYLSVTETMLLANTAPLFLPFIGFFWLRSKMKSVIWPGIILGFLGIYLILKPTPSLLGEIGDLYGISAGVSLAVVMLSLRLLAHSVDSKITMFYFFLFGSIVFGAISFFYWTPFDLSTMLILLSIGFINLFGQYCITKSYKYGEASQLSPFSYSVIVYAILLDWILYKIVPDRMSFIGIALVCTGGILTIILTTPKTQGKKS